MSTADPAALAEHFERLADLKPAAREAALGALEPQLAARLRRLFAAESSDHDPIAAAIAAAAGAPLPHTGQRLGAWRIVREIGSGGMGTVFLAERADEQFTQQAAIKLIRGFATEDGRRRLRQERQILAGLDHPNIARLLDGGETHDGQPWVAMEYVEGRELLDHVAQQRLDLDARLQLFDRIAAAVQHAHQRLVVHRDLKPRNVLVRADGEPRLLDFGVAKLVDLGADTGGRDTSTRVWTPGYASPEQRRGAAVTTVTDVFSLGIMLRELLTGDRSEHAAAQGLPDGFEALAPDADLRGAITKASAEDPAQRYASVEALRDDLRRYRDHRPLRAARDTAWYRARKFVFRHRLASGLALAAIVALGLFIWRLDAERERAVAAELAAQTSSAAAQRSADNANHTLRFVIGVFQGASPESTLGRTVTPRMLVDDARARLDTEVGDDPLVRRTLQAALGQIYSDLGEPRRASELLRSATDGFEPVDRSEGLWLAGAVDVLSDALLAIAPDGVAQSATVRAAELFEQWAGSDPEMILRAANSRAQAAYLRGDMAETIARQREVLALARNLPSTPPNTVFGARMVLADALRATGDLAAAEQETAALLIDVERELPELHPRTIKVMRVRAAILGELGRYRDAEVLFRTGLERIERLVGSDNQSTADFLNDLSVMLSAAGRYREALDALQQSRAIERQLGASEASASAVVLANLASLQENVGEYEQAVANAARALELLAASSTTESAHLRKVEGNLARALSFGGRHADSRALFEKVRAQHKAAGEPRAFDYAMETFRQGSAERLAGRLDAASALFDESMPALTTALGEAHPVIAFLKRQRGHLAIERGDYALALSELTAAREILVKSDASPFDLAFVDLSLATLAARQGDPVKARRLLATVLPPLRENVGPKQVNRVEAERLARELGLRM